MVRSSSSHLRQAGAELKDSARHVWLAGIGALATAKDQGGRLFESLVEHGRKVEASTVPLLNGLRQQAEDLLAGLRRTVSRGSGAGAAKRAKARSGGAAQRGRKPAARKKAAASTATRARKTPNRGKSKSSRRRS
jgi:Poly(hydroxyalcanoate) granule associated protein (phasin)